MRPASSLRGRPGDLFFVRPSPARDKGAPAANPHELFPQPHRPACSIHDGNNQSDENNDQEHSPEQPAAVLDKKLARHVSALDGTRHTVDAILYANTIKLSR